LKGERNFVRAFLLPGDDEYGQLSLPPECWPTITTPAGPPPPAGVVFLGTLNGLSRLLSHGYKPISRAWRQNPFT
jgi:hypothetical protein